MKSKDTQQNEALTHSKKERANFRLASVAAQKLLWLITFVS